MKALEKSVHEVIVANLPQQVAGELKSALEDYERLQREVDKLRENNKSLSDEIKEATEDKLKAIEAHRVYTSDVKQLKEDKISLAGRIADLDKREMLLDLELAKRELEIEKSARAHVETFMLNMSRSSVYKKTILQDRNCVIPPTPGLADDGMVLREPISGFTEKKFEELEEIVTEE